MRLLLALLAACLLVSGCTDKAPGGDDPGTTSASGTSTGPSGTNTTPPPVELVPVSIDVELAGAYPVNIAYDPDDITVAANNEVTIVFTNNEQNPIPGHNWVLEGVDGASTSVIANGATAEVTFAAPAPGEYTFFCSVGDHRERGMVGTFTVTA